MTEDPAGDPRFVPWPGPPTSNWALRRELLEGYMRTAKRFEAYRASRKHAQVLRRFAFLNRQHREIWAEQTIRKREIAMVTALRQMLEVRPEEVSTGEEDLSPPERLDLLLHLFRSGRGRRKDPSSLPRADRMMESKTVLPMMEAARRRIREEARLGVRKDRQHEWAWALALGIFEENQNIWIRLALVPTPLDFALTWLERRATGATLLAPTDPLRPLPLALDHQAELESDVARLERHEELVVTERQQILERLVMGRMFAFDPMVASSPEAEEFDQAVVLPSLLCVFRRIEMDRILQQDAVPEARPHPDHDRDIREMSRLCRLLPEFWWFAVRGLLWRTGGLMPDGSLAPWVEKFLVGLLEHPGPFARAPVPREALKARSVFARHVAPLARMTCPEHRQPLLLNRDGARDPVFFLGCVSWTLAQRSGIDLDEIPPPSAQGEHAIVSLVSEEILPIADRLLASMAQCSAEPPHAPYEMYAEAGAAPVEAAGPVEAAAAEPAVTPWTFTPPEVPEEAPLFWRYVRNPLEEHGRSLSLGAIRAREAGRAEEFFREHGIPTVVKPRSVLRALRYFEGMPEEIRRMLPSESAGGHRWAKLKRGGLRILLRVAGPGSAEFHLLPRSHWTRPLEFL
jgi:hypothetical protein